VSTVTYAVRMIDVTSSNVGRIGYDAEAERLYVQFRDQAANTRDGTLYAYESVPERVYRRLVAAAATGESVGRLFTEKVKKAGFEYRRVKQ